jgi:hypothetical protein
MDQDILAQSVTQVYPIGMKLDRDVRRFRYAKGGAALGGLARLVINGNYCPGCTGHTNEAGFEGAVGFAASIGDTYIDIADTVARAKDYYQGGMVIVYGTTIFHQHYIVRSDLGDGSKVRLYLDRPLAGEDITIAMGCTAYLSQYSNARPAANKQVGFEKFVGLPLIPVTLNYYFWMQTKGPCIVTPTGGTWPGSAANLRDVYANPADGTIQPATLSDPSLGYQRIGTVISVTGGDASDYGDCWIDLDVDPN